ncbi:UNVERIFIED_CONTAM: hypothetical protein K2H54_039918 [Gekko kuhli]
MKLAEQVRILKLTKQELQKECQKQQVDCEDRTAAKMEALLLSCGKSIGKAAAECPSQQNEVQLKELEMEKLCLQAQKEDTPPSPKEDIIMRMQNSEFT